MHMWTVTSICHTEIKLNRVQAISLMLFPPIFIKMRGKTVILPVMSLMFFFQKISCHSTFTAPSTPLCPVIVFQTADLLANA